MSSIKVTNLLQASSSTNNMVLTSGGDVQVTNNLQFNSGYGSAATAYGCRAWVNFNGTTATPSTIRASGNVSSVTKNSTGNYTVNFTTALPDVNYSAVASANSSGNTNTVSPITFATTSFNFDSQQSGAGGVDRSILCVAIFR